MLCTCILAFVLYLNINGLNDTKLSLTIHVFEFSTSFVSRYIIFIFPFSLATATLEESTDPTPELELIQQINVDLKRLTRLIQGLYCLFSLSYILQICWHLIAQRVNFNTLYARTCYTLNHSLHNTIKYNTFSQFFINYIYTFSLLRKSITFHVQCSSFETDTVDYS